MRRIGGGKACRENVREPGSPYSVTEECERSSTHMFSRWISLRGVSRTHNINFRFSFKQTSAEREINSSQNPIRIAASVFIEHGTTIMPS